MDVWGRDEVRQPIDTGWTFRKSLNIGIILGLLANAAAGVWWAANITATTAAANQQIVALSTLPERMARIEERIAAMQRDVGDIKTSLNARRAP